MRLTVPITGTVIGFNLVEAKAGGIGISGDPNDPVRLIELDLGNVNWSLISIDLENDIAEIEVTPSKVFSEDTGQVHTVADPENNVAVGDHIYVRKQATAQDKQRFLDEAEAKVNKTKEQLYAETGSPKLKKLKKHVDDYKKFKAEEARR